MFVKKRRKLELEVKIREKLEKTVAVVGLENCVMRLPQGCIYRETNPNIGFVWLQGLLIL